MTPPVDSTWSGAGSGAGASASHQVYLSHRVLTVLVVLAGLGVLAVAVMGFIAVGAVLQFGGAFTVFR